MDGTADGRERMRERVAGVLERELSFVGNPLGKADAALRRSISERVEEQLRAFKAAGLLSEAEVTGWRERFVRAAEAVDSSDHGVATPQVRARAADILEAHISALQATGAEQRGSDESARFHAVVAALKSVGALSKEDEQCFRERRNSIIWPSKPTPPPTAPSPQSELLRVAVGPSERKGGVRVTAAELFTGFVRLWWHLTISPEEIAERERQQALNKQDGPLAVWRRAAGRFQLSDDLGTRYEPEIVGSDEDTPWLWLTTWRLTPKTAEPLPLFGRAIFTPAVPERATRWKPSAAPSSSCST